MLWFKPPRVSTETSDAIGASAAWIEKNWGKSRPILKLQGFEIWEAFGRQGHRTSYHAHPKHQQTVYLLSGAIEIVTDSGQLPVRESDPVEVGARFPHELRFLSDCHFVEVYRGRGDVMGTIRRIYQ